LIIQLDKSVIGSLKKNRKTGGNHMKKSETKKNNEIILDMEKTNGVYVKKKSFFLKRWWENYLGRLNKVTDGKPQCCK